MDKLINDIPRSSKRLASKEIYKYYAGFSEGFIEDLLFKLEVNTESLILDPWNGSGTTTYVAASRGIKAIGIDLNPIMYIISKAKLRTFQEDEANLSILFKQSRKYRKQIKSDDALQKWFEKKTIVYIRNIERAILDGKNLGAFIPNIDDIDVDQCFYLLVLINVIKKYTKKVKSSNPTWIKQNKEGTKIVISREELEQTFTEEYFEVNRIIKRKNKPINIMPNLRIGNSEKMNLVTNTIDLVITSPPYCTRIDYAVMTSIELALLDIEENKFLELRHSLTGGPVIHQSQPRASKEWGSLCLNTLNQIRSHYSRSSEGYYYKTYLQYFHSMYKSFKEIDRVLKNNSKCVIVVQDSFYKEIFINLKEIFSEFAKSLGWVLVEKFNFEVKHNLMQTNPKSRKYKKNQEVNEHVLIFKKGV